MKHALKSVQIHIPTSRDREGTVGTTMLLRLHNPLESTATPSRAATIKNQPTRRRRLDPPTPINPPITSNATPPGAGTTASTPVRRMM